MQITRKRKIDEIEYPESDGEPMAETDVHRNWMFASIGRLQRFFAGQEVYVSGNLLIYYQEGDPHKSVAPDTFVVKNCRPGDRRIFRIWKEKRTPNFVLETTSKKTRENDKTEKKELYGTLGVGEYFLYDPLAEWLKPPLQGFRLMGSAYEPIPAAADGSILSEELGVRLVLQDGELVMFDARTGERLLSDREAAEQEKREKEKAEQGRDEERRCADQERRRADEERRRADEERRLREAAEQRNKVLEEEIVRLREASKKTNGHKRKNGK